MTNELLFLFHVSCVGICLLIALRIGKEALIALVSLFTVLANLFVVKQIGLLGLNATASDAYAVGCMLGINLLQEYYDKATARSAIIISFFVAIVFTLAAQIHLGYTPLALDKAHEAFALILGSTARIVAASLATFYIVQQSDLYLYGFLKRRCEKFYVLRNWGSVAISQLLDTVLFSYLGLYGIVADVWHIIWISYSIKMIILLGSTPFLLLARIARNKN